MPRALTVCNRKGCTTKIPQGQGRCDACATQADRERRPHGNPYATRGHLLFREAVLTRDPVCVICDIRLSTVADHYPIERVDLVAAGKDPNDPAAGRGLCDQCHREHTAATSPGGWNAANHE